MHVEAERLINFEISADGERLRLCGEDAGGAPVSFSLPTELLTQMVMTLPRMAEAALQLRHQDQSLRIVYPSPYWRIEAGGGHATFILRLGTQDGFEVSFGLGRAEMGAMSSSIQKALHSIVEAPATH
jgi:hypothetical protein